MKAVFMLGRHSLSMLRRLEVKLARANQPRFQCWMNLAGEARSLFNHSPTLIQPLVPISLTVIVIQDNVI